jgi:hypothetical protein
MIPTLAGTDVLVHAKRRKSLEAPPNPADVTANAYQSMIANLQHKVTIVQLQAEIQTFKAHSCGTTTPSTVTEMSTPASNIQEPSTTDDRMATIETNMEILTKQFSTNYVRTIMDMVLENHNHRLAHQQVPQDKELLAASSKTGTKHAIEEYSASQQSKRADTCTTPTCWADPMNIDGSLVQLFLENAVRTPTHKSCESDMQIPAPSNTT